MYFARWLGRPWTSPGRLDGIARGALPFSLVERAHLGDTVEFWRIGRQTS